MSGPKLSISIPRSINSEGSSDSLKKRMQDIHNNLFTKDRSQENLLAAFKNNGARLLREDPVQVTLIYDKTQTGGTLGKSKEKSKKHAAKPRNCLLYNEFIGIIKTKQNDKVTVKAVLPFTDLLVNFSVASYTSNVPPNSIAVISGKNGAFILSFSSEGVLHDFLTLLQAHLFSTVKELPNWEDAPGWKHRVLLGTPFSDVVTGNTASLKVTFEKATDKISLANKRDADEIPLLHYAIYYGDLAMCQLILDHGALVDAVDAQHRTALQIALHCLNPSFLRRPASATSGSSSAAPDASPDVPVPPPLVVSKIELLLQYGAQPNERRGLPLRTAILAVTDVRHAQSIINLLFRYGARQELLRYDKDIMLRFACVRDRSVVDSMIDTLLNRTEIEKVFPDCDKEVGIYERKVIPAGVSLVSNGWVDERAMRDSSKWTPDGSSETCQLCVSEFTLFFRRHHCRACYRLICADCSTKRLPIPDPIRVCDGCFNNHFRLSTLKEGPQSVKEEAKEGTPDEIPEGIDRPSAPVTVEIKSLEEKLADFVVPMAVKRLNDLLFEEDAEFFAAFAKAREYRDMEIGKWEVSEGASNLSRELRFIVPVKNKMVKADSTPVLEQQQYLLHDEFRAYVVDILSKTPEVPFGTAFAGRIRIALMYNTPGSTRVLITFQVEFTQSVMVKGIIKSSATSGMEAFVTQYRASLSKFV